MHLTHFNMKNLLPLFILTLFLASCGSGDKQSVDAVIESQNIESIRAKKTELVSEQNLIKEEIKKLKNNLINKNIPDWRDKQNLENLLKKISQK